MGSMRVFNATLVALLVVTLMACAGGGSAIPHGTAPGVGGNAATPGGGNGVGGVRGWPAFPGDIAPGAISPAKKGSGTQTLNGTAWAQQSGANNYADTLVPNAYVIVPGGGGDALAYARYTLPGMATARPVRMDLHITAASITPGGEDDLPLSYWVGVSDYTQFAWQWFGPKTAEQISIALNDKASGVLDRYVSSSVANNTFHVVVATAAEKRFITPQNPLGLSAARIEQIVVNTLAVTDPAYGSTRPHFARIESIGTGGGKQGSALDPAQYVTLHWTHFYDPDDADSEAVMYKLYRQGPMDAARVPIGSVNAPTAQYTDPTDNSPGIDDPVPGATYRYFLRAYDPQGYSAYDEDECTIPLLGPADVQASDGLYADKVVLTWTRAEGATGYKIYRDGQTEAELIATVGDVASYEDSAVADLDLYTYWMRSTNQYMPDGGEWSTPDSGYLDLGQAPVILDIQPQSGEPGQVITFTATVQGFTPMTYAWDFGGGATPNTSSNVSPQVTLGDEGTYSASLTVINTYGSDNRPFTLRVMSPQVQLCTVPPVLDSSIDRVQILYPEPKVRRDGRLVMDPFGGTLDPYDPIGYADVLKCSGSEFPICVAGAQVFPTIVIEETQDPSDITGPNDPDQINGILVLNREMGRMSVDIAILTPPDPLPGIRYYCYKLFNANTSSAGWGQFAVQSNDVEWPAATGIAWGINSFNRTTDLLADFNGLCTNHTVNGDTMALTTPDVLWVRISSDAWVFDWNEYWSDTDPWDPPTNDNVMLVIEDTDGITGSLVMKLLVVGIEPDGDVIAIHHFNLKDDGPGGTGEYWDWKSLVPGMPGILIPTHSYYVHLDDPRYAGYEWTSPNNLDVVGANPNGP